MKVTDKITITNEDNMELMARYPDNYFDLAIVDPPYGIKMHGGKRQYNSYSNKDWDNDIPSKEYFKELFRVSKNQVIWGGNYFTEYLYPSRCWYIWDKTIHGNTFADGELAWTSYNKNTRIYPLNICHNQGKRFHPTQKPIKLYEWILLSKYTEGNKILDTHLGSGSIAIACDRLGFELTACELDKEYYEASINRIKKEISQKRLF